jgi:hypothetical protein
MCKIVKSAFGFVVVSIKTLMFIASVYMEQIAESILAGETITSGGNLAKCLFVHHKSHMNFPEMKPKPLP